MRVGIYTRLSRDRDGTQTATARQLSDCRALAEREGWEVGAVYEDSDLSGFKRGVVRPDYEQMLADLDARTIDGILVWKLDRLSRQPGQFEAVVSACERLGARIYSVHESADMTSPAGLAMMRVGMAFAAMESETISLRTRRAKAELADRGEPNGGGLRPFGLDPSKRHLVPDEARQIREAARRVIAGEGLTTIAKDWERRGILSSRGNGWTVTALRRMLVNPRLEGKRVHRGRVIDSDTIPAILDSDTAERVRQLLGRDAGEYLRRPRALSGLVRCGRCGGRLTVKRRKGGQPLYRCFKAPGGVNCGGLSVAAEPLEELIADLLIDALGDVQLTSAGDQWSGTELLALTAQREELVRDHYVNHLVSRGDFLIAHTALTDRIARLEADMDRLRRRELLADVNAGDALRDRWDHADAPWRHELARTYIERVEVGPGVRGSNRFDEKRVTVVWRG